MHLFVQTQPVDVLLAILMQHITCYLGLITYVFLVATLWPGLHTRVSHSSLKDDGYPELSVEKQTPAEICSKTNLFNKRLAKRVNISRKV